MPARRVSLPCGCDAPPSRADRAEFDRLATDPHAAAAMSWDILVSRRSAAWHHTNGRVFLQSMFGTGAPDNIGGSATQ